MKATIDMDDLWENYSLVLHKDGEDATKITYIKVKDFFGKLEIVDNENKT